MHNIKEIVNKFNPEENIQEAQRQAAENIVEIAKKRNWDLSHFHVRELFDVFCNWDGSVNMHDPVKIHEAIMSSQFPYITKELISPVFIKGYNYSLAGIDRLVTEQDSSHPEENIPGFTASRGAQERPVGMAFEEVTIGEKVVKVINRDFGLIVRLTQEMIMYDQTGSIVTQAKGISRKLGADRHKMIAEKITDVACTITGEAANHTLYYNGAWQTIYSDDHSAIDGVTNDNNHTTAFGTSGMTASWTLLQKMKDENGDEITGIQPRQGLFPVNLGVSAWQMKNPVNIGYAPDTTKKERNFFAQQGYLDDIITSPVLDATSATKYYVGEFDQQFIWLWVERPTTTIAPANSELAFKNRIVFGARFSFWGGIGAMDYRYVVKGGT